VKGSTYLAWAKRHAAARYNLASSGIAACTLDDLGVALEEIAINGPNEEGFGPLVDRIAAHHGLNAAEVVTAEGASMANFLAFASLLERGDHVLVERPTYEPLLAALAYLGADIRRFDRHFENGYELDPTAVERALSPRTRLIVVTSPHNPSGVTTAAATLGELGRIASATGAHVLIDEVYRDILFEDAPASAARLGPPLIATGSLTKSYGLGGLRCGWILCAAPLAAAARRLKDLLAGTGSMPGEALAVAAFDHLPALRARSRAILEPNAALVRAFLRERHEVLECVVPKRSTVVFPRLVHAADSEPLNAAARRLETSIVPGRFFEAPRHFRLGFGALTAELEAGLVNLGSALDAIC
jgi:aspartate/methionine/tyrosine aminotransferase